MGVVDSFYFEDKLRIEGSVRDVRIQHQFRVLINLFGGDMKDYIFGFANVQGHSVTLKPNGHFSKFHANPSHESL
jgi:hypothetical protein